MRIFSVIALLVLFAACQTTSEPRRSLSVDDGGSRSEPRTSRTIEPTVDDGGRTRGDEHEITYDIAAGV